MTQTARGISRFTPDDVKTWYQAKGRQIFLSDVVDESNGGPMSIGFARYSPGQSNDWIVTYDEALIVTRGSYSVTSADGHTATVGVGGVIVLEKGTKLTYSAGDTGAEVVYVTYPHWMEAQRRSEHAALLDDFQPATDAPPESHEPPVTDNVALMRSLWGPLERGESSDLGPFFDALADDVVFTLPVGELRGRQAVVDYFATAGDTIEFQPFEKPLEYHGAGNRVVILGDETFRLKLTGATHRAGWAWVIDVHNGRIARIVAIQDLTGVAEAVRDVIAKVQSGGS